MLQKAPQTGLARWAGPFLLVTGLLALLGCSEPEFARRHTFKAHKAELERIVQMSDSDYAKTSVTRIAYDFTRLENDWGWPRDSSKLGLTEARWIQYKRLFRAIGLPAGIDREKGEIRFMTWGSGMAGEGLEDGILWAPRGATSEDTPRQQFQVKHLEGNWYLYSWYIP